jgi:hypothetical protein
MSLSLNHFRVGVLCSAAVIGACTSPSSPSAIEGRLEVTAVAFQVTRPPVVGDVSAQVRAVVAGQLPDGCTEVGQVGQRRDGNVVTVTIATTRPADAACTMVVRAVEASVLLDGTFTAGDYVVRVNGFEVRPTF